MKKIFLWLLIMTIAPIAFAAETQKDYGKLCEELWGQHLILESFPVQEKCSIDGENLSLASFQDKYNHFVLGMMIHYASEFKYSAADKWKDYNEFLNHVSFHLLFYDDQEHKLVLHVCIVLRLILYWMQSLHSKLLYQYQYLLCL